MFSSKEIISLRFLVVLAVGVWRHRGLHVAIRYVLFTRGYLFRSLHCLDCHPDCDEILCAFRSYTGRPADQWWMVLNWTGGSGVLEVYRLIQYMERGLRNRVMFNDCDFRQRLLEGYEWSPSSYVLPKLLQAQSSQTSWANKIIRSTLESCPSRSMGQAAEPGPAKMDPRKHLQLNKLLKVIAVMSQPFWKIDGLTELACAAGFRAGWTGPEQTAPEGTSAGKES